MLDNDDSGEHMMRTRKKRRNYKSLEDGKEEIQSANSKQNQPTIAKQLKPQKDNIISIDTHNYKSAPIDPVKPPKADLSENSDNGKT